MPQTRLTPADADFIMKLDEVGYSNSEIARKLGVTEGAVRYRLKRQASGEPDGRTSKPSNLDAFREWIGAWIGDYEESRRRPTLRLLEQMLREHHGYGRSYDALRRYIRKHFPEFHKKGARCRLETPPGKLLFVDWKGGPPGPDRRSGRLGGRPGPVFRSWLQPEDDGLVFVP
jgi:transposase